MTILPTRIVLCGVSGSGKSTLGEKLMENYGYQVYAFADPLKHATQAIFGFEDDHLWGPSSLRETPYPNFLFTGWCFECHVQCRGPERHLAPRFQHDAEAVAGALAAYANVVDYWRCPSCESPFPKYVTVREALKTLGTAWGRKFCADLWATACFTSMSPTLSYVVTDCRFKNEVFRAREYQSLLVLLRRKLEQSTSTHPSEAEVRELAKTPGQFDIVLDNREGTPAENYLKLLNQIDELQQSGTAIRRIGWAPHAPIEEEEFPWARAETP